MKPGEAVERWKRARDAEREAKAVAAGALAVAASALTGRTWTAQTPDHGISCESGPCRLAWTELNQTPRIHASYREGVTYVAIMGPDVATAMDRLTAALRSMGVTL